VYYVKTAWHLFARSAAAPLFVQSVEVYLKFPMNRVKRSPVHTIHANLILLRRLVSAVFVLLFAPCLRCDTLWQWHWEGEHTGGLCPILIL
jgi:hypothetical protein